MNTKSQKFQIRFNTVSTCEEDRWRLITDGEEILVSNIVVDGHTSTSKDWMQDIKDYKWHISCEGYVSIKNNIAYNCCNIQPNVIILILYLCLVIL